jgi:hypothetical protein
METTAENNSSDAYVHTAHVKEKLGELIDHLREDVTKIENPQAKALFEVSAEVIEGLKKAFTDFEEKKESAWKE